MAVQMRTSASTDLIQTNAQVSRKTTQGTQNGLSAGDGFKNFLDGSKNLSSVKNSQNMGSAVKQQSVETAPKDGTVNVPDDVRKVVEELREDKRFEKALESLDRAISGKDFDSGMVSEGVSENVSENVKELAQKVLNGEIDIKDIPDDISAEELIKEIIAIMMQQRFYPEKDDEQEPKLFDPATAAVNEHNLERNATDQLITELYKLIEKHGEDKDEKKVTMLDGISEPTDADETLASAATGELQAEQAEKGAFEQIFDNMAETAEDTVKAVEAVDAVETAEPTAPVTMAEPTEPIATAEPTEPIATAEPTEPIATAEPTEPIATAEPTEPIATAEPTAPVAAAEPTEPIATAEPTAPVMTAEPTELVVTAEPTEPIATAEPTAPVMTAEPTELVVTAEPTEPAAAAEPTEPVATAEPTEPTESFKTIEPTETAELSENVAANVKSTPTFRTQFEQDETANTANTAPAETAQAVKAPEQGAETNGTQMRFDGQTQKTEQVNNRVDDGKLDEAVQEFTVKEPNVPEPAKTEAPVKANVTTAPQSRVQNASEELEMLKSAKFGKKEPTADTAPAATVSSLTSEQPVVFTRADGTKLEINPSEIVDQTARIIEAAIKETQQQSEYSLVLNPEELGRITVKLIKAADGAVSVTVAAENAHTQRVLEQHSELMQSNLRANGTNLASWQTVNESRQETYAQDYNGSSKNPYFRRDEAQRTDEDNTDTTFADLIASM